MLGLDSNCTTSRSFLEACGRDGSEEVFSTEATL